MMTLSMVVSSLTASSLVTVDIPSPTPISKSDENFVCLGMDWWPSNKCNWGVCPWGDAGILNSDLSNEKLRTAVKRMNGAYLRLGGSLCDGIVYNVGNPPSCPDMTPKPPAQGTWFHGGCLSMDRWGEIVQFADDTDAKLVFAINANYNRTDGGTHWDESNARALIEHTVAMKYNVFAFEYGNELGYNASVFAAGLHQLHEVITTAYAKDPSLTVPKIIAPDEIHWDNEFFSELIPLVEGIVHAVTWHEYPLGEGYQNPSLNSKVMDPNQHNGWFNTASMSAKTTANVSSGKMQAWMGESGGCSNSGHNGTSNRFMDAFWYIDSLGGLAAAGQKVFCRQALIGGNYELIDHRNMEPNPDFYGALLFNSFMGSSVLNATSDNELVRAWAHCNKNSSDVSFLLMNFGNNSAEVKLPTSSKTTRDEYHMTATFINATEVMLNGNVMTYDSPISPVQGHANTNLVLANNSYAYVVTQLPGLCQ
eukprot:TRINITY_DN1645_c0_g1_i1.p1 TRINITY_DN1645_c0_g1~~TRINITY_DN1645_c0_g1_i1.p1  ORF type:complete len:479 (+),score=92.04 TRINITY_DN1645_c0_g1_i1:60-1496(+)